MPERENSGRTVGLVGVLAVVSGAAVVELDRVVVEEVAVRAERKEADVRLEGEVAVPVPARTRTPLGRAPWCLVGAQLKARRGGRTAVAARARGRAPSRVKVRGRVSIAARGGKG